MQLAAFTWTYCMMFAVSDPGEDSWPPTSGHQNDSVHLSEWVNVFPLLVSVHPSLNVTTTALE